jgi:3-phenylpropionate/cinnamic acid dioxygenase small subunit
MLETFTIEEAMLRLEIEDFFWYEADLLDEHRYQEWLDLFTKDMKYWMPLRRNVASKEMDADLTKEGPEIAWFIIDFVTLERRVQQVMTGVHWAV